MNCTKKLMRFDKPKMVKGFHDFCLTIGEATKGKPLHIVEVGSYELYPEKAVWEI